MAVPAQLPAVASPALNGEILPPGSGMPAPKPVYHDVTVRTTKKTARARCEAVAAEEFGIERGARTIKEANYACHEIVTKTEGELIAEGFDEEQISELQTYTGQTNTETLQRDTVHEHDFSGNTANKAARYIRYTEHYIRFDYEGRGRPILYQVITGGERGEVLFKNGKACIEPFDAIPFAAGTPIPQTHRFIGRSIADIVIPLQREKTAMKRGALDNMYLSNNPRVEVAKQFSNANTLDDLLVSRPGGVVRVDRPGGVNWQEVPNNIGAIMPAMQYLDAELETRTGLSKQSQGIDANALQNQTATATAQVFSASQMRVKLLARILAEGVRDIFSLLHGTVRKHGQQSQTIQLRRQWVDIDPREWKKRDHMTVNVGLGNGGKAQQFAQTMALANVQKEFVAAGKTNIVGDTELYNTACELTKIMSHKNPHKFFKDPDAKDPQTGQLLNPPGAPKPDPKTQAIQAQSQADMAQAQQRAQHDQQAAQQDFQHQQMQAQMDAALAQFKAQLDAKLKLVDAHVAVRREVRAEHRERRGHQLDLAGKVADIIGNAHAHDTAMAHKHADHQARVSQIAAAADQGEDDGH